MNTRKHNSSTIVLGMGQIMPKYAQTLEIGNTIQVGHKSRSKYLRNWE